MKVTVDANILFACLITDGVTRRIWFNPEISLFAPRFILNEFLKYKQEIVKKFKGTEKEFDQLLEKALLQVKLVSDEDLKPFIPAVKTLIADEKDWLYLACALKEDTIIWSNDNDLKKQSRIKVKTTQELIEEVGTL
ncbi:MAG: PIN domain-containing protein [archaeon]|nr:PIN domain-containing protein [archaeon]